MFNEGLMIFNANFVPHENPEYVRNETVINMKDFDSVLEFGNRQCCSNSVAWASVKINKCVADAVGIKLVMT